MPLVANWVLAGGVPLHQWGPRQFLNALIVGLISGAVTIVFLRLQLLRRGRRLTARAIEAQWEWACIARIRVGEQLVFGPGVRPIFKGPVGTFAFDGRQLIFIPDNYCRRRGYVDRDWGAAEARVVSEARRRDFSGLAYRDLDLLLAGYRVRAFVSYEVGQRPRSLLPEQRQV